MSNMHQNQFVNQIERGYLVLGKSHHISELYIPVL